MKLLNIKLLKKLALYLFFSALASCSSGLQINSLKDAPPIPKNKARAVHIFQNSADMWKLFPIYISIDKKPVTRIDAKRFSIIDVDPGSRMFSYFQEKAVGARDGVSLTFLEGETRYFLCRPELKTGAPDFYRDKYRLRVSELTALEAERYLRQ